MGSINPYAPSWLNKLTKWFQSFRAPAWMIYTIFFAIYSVVLGIQSRRMVGVLPVGNWTSLDVYEIFSGAVMVTAILAFYHYFEREVLLVIDESESLFNLSKEKMEKLKFEIVALPALPILIISVVFFLVGVGAAIDQYNITRIGIKHIPFLIDFGLGSLFLFTFAFRIGRFIFQIRSLFAKLTYLDLYNLSSIYELPSLAAKAGLFYLPIWYINLLANINTALSAPIFLGVSVFGSIVPLAAFVFPIGALRRQLSLQKKEEIVQVSLQLKRAYEIVSTDFDQRKLAKMENLKAAIANLDSHRRYLESVSVWPWKQGTFRLTLTAVMLPILVWFLQQILNALLGF